MSKIICSAAIRGAHKIVNRVEKKYKEVLEKYGPDQEIGFPDTTYYLPIICIWLSHVITSLFGYRPLERIFGLFPEPYD